jgi:hypothetical protein
MTSATLQAFSYRFFNQKSQHFGISFIKVNAFCPFYYKKLDGRCMYTGVVVENV